jgi:hypothetical protein
MARTGHFPRPPQNDPFGRSPASVFLLDSPQQENDMIKTTPATLLLLGALVAGVAIGLSGLTRTAHVLATLEEATWGPAPPVLLPGAPIAVLGGGPVELTYVHTADDPRRPTGTTSGK